MKTIYFELKFNLSKELKLNYLFKIFHVFNYFINLQTVNAGPCFSILISKTHKPKKRYNMEMEIDNPNNTTRLKSEGLFKAAEVGDSSVFESLSQQNLLKIVSLRNEDQRSLLHVAASFGHTQVHQLILVKLVTSIQKKDHN